MVINISLGEIPDLKKRLRYFIGKIGGPRILHPAWSIELEEDLNIHGINIEDELTNIMSKEIQQQIDLELMKEITENDYTRK